MISSKDGGAYALQTILGWCIVGPTECTSGKVDTVSCNRIAVNDAATNKILSHHFEVQDQGRKLESRKCSKGCTGWILVNPVQRFMT